MVGLPKWTKFERKKKVSTVSATCVVEEFICGKMPVTEGSMVPLI